MGFKPMNILRKRARHSVDNLVDSEVLASASMLSADIDRVGELAGKIVNSNSEENEFAGRRTRSSADRDQSGESRGEIQPSDRRRDTAIDTKLASDAEAIDRDQLSARHKTSSADARAVGRNGKPAPMTTEADLANLKKTATPQESSALSPSKSPTLMPLDIDVPSEISKYAIGARMGSGTCGVVHKALDNVLAREVAIKLSPIGEAKASTGKVPGAQRAYQTEVHAAGRLRHPNIVTVFDAGQDQNLNYIVMEAVDGHSLKHFGKGQKLLPAYRALEVICECCKALDYSHRQAILHRDIKPANIMIGNDGSVKLLDFGIAVGLSEESGLDLTGPTLGTPNYMSPEQILGRKLTPASDFYSLGTVLFELLTGKQLFKAKKVKDLFRTVVHQRAPQLYDFRPELTRELSDVLDKALSKKPEERYQSGMEMIHALSGFIEQFRIVEELPASHRALLPALRKLPFFNSVPEADVARLVAHTELRELAVGDDLLPDGNFDRQLLLLIDGVVVTESRVSSVDSRPPLRGLYGPGQCIGEYGFIHGARENVRYRATSDQQALVLSTDTLSQLAPKLHLHYYKQISDTLLRRMATEQMPFTPDILL